MSEHSIIEVVADDGYVLHCRFWEASNPRAVMVLTHGVVSHSLWLEAVTSALADEGIHCLAADRRGAGLNSTNPGDAPDGQTLVADLLAVTRRATSMGVPVHWCGFCWGANLIVNAVPDAPGHIHSISLLAPSLFPSARITEQTFRCGSSSEPTEPPTMPIECFTSGPAYQNFILPDTLRLQRVSQRMNSVMRDFSQGLWMKFLRIRLPTLVILANEDEVVDNNATLKLFERLPCSPKKLESLPGKHGIQFDAPTMVVHQLLAWIDTIPYTKPSTET